MAKLKQLPTEMTTNAAGALAVADLLHQRDVLYRALSRCAGQWAFSVHNEACSAALAEAEEPTEKKHNG